jgi:hypothetical protein
MIEKWLDAKSRHRRKQTEWINTVSSIRNVPCPKREYDTTHLDSGGDGAAGIGALV